MRPRGARARALAVLLLASALPAVWRAVGTPARSPIPMPVAGLSEDGQVRVLPLEEARRRAAESLPRCGAQPGFGEGEWLDQRCRRRPLPLGVRRALCLPIDLNALGPEELEELPGIGPALARRIVETRRRLGGFRGTDDLLEVPGIGPAKLEALRAALNPERR